MSSIIYKLPVTTIFPNLWLCHQYSCLSKLCLRLHVSFFGYEKVPKKMGPTDLQPADAINIPWLYDANLHDKMLDLNFRAKTII